LPYVLTAEQDLQVVLKAVRLMDELGILSPTSRERSLDELPRKELQQLAKEAGVKVTSDSCHLLWLAYLQSNNLVHDTEGAAVFRGT